MVDDYFLGRLPGKKQEKFELHYFSCEGCFTYLKAVERLYSKEVKIEVDETTQAEPEREVERGAKAKLRLNTQTREFKNWMQQWGVSWKPSLAAALVVIALVASFFVLRQAGYRKNLIEISTFNPPVYMKSEMRNSTEKNHAAFEEAMVFYNKKEYRKALEILETIQNKPGNPRTIFFKGICYLLCDQPSGAVTEFEKIIDAMNPSYYDEAIYYHAIGLLRLNEVDRALEELQNLAADTYSPYAPNAWSLIDKIKAIH